MPISPAPIAPSTASVSACNPTSASEWPTRPCSCGIATPQIHDMIAGAEGVHVETLADADIALPRGEQPLGRGEILGGRHLQIVLAAVDDQRREARRLGDCGVVGQLTADGGAVGGEDRVEVKSLRRLGPPQARSGRPSRRMPALDALDRVAERQAGIAAGALSSPSMTRSISAGIGKRPRAIMDQHAARVVSAPALQGRAAPNPAAPRRRRPAAARSSPARRCRTARGLPAGSRPHAIDPRMRGESSDRMAQDSGAAERQVLLGQRAAKPGAPAGRDDKRIDRAHCRKLNRGTPNCQRPATTAGRRIADLAAKEQPTATQDRT